MKGENSSLIYLMNCKSLCKFHNVPLPSTTIKIKSKKLHRGISYSNCINQKQRENMKPEKGKTNALPREEQREDFLWNSLQKSCKQEGWEGDTIEVLQEKAQPRILHPVKLSFKNKEEIKASSGKN
jgi:hypothetical protein